MKAYVIGEAAEDFAASSATCRTRSAGRWTAVVGGAGRGREGETVLLAPACASFDQYASFEARGEDFEALVSGMSEVGHDLKA